MALICQFEEIKRRPKTSKCFLSLLDLDTLSEGCIYLYMFLVFIRRSVRISLVRIEESGVRIDVSVCPLACFCRIFHLYLLIFKRNYR